MPRSIGRDETTSPDRDSPRTVSATDHSAFDEAGLPGFQFIQERLEYNSRTHHSNMDTFDHVQGAELTQQGAVERTLAEHRAIENAPNGLGDLMAALFLARLLEGLDDEKALQLATASVFEILARTKKREMNELTLETDASSLSTPMAMVQMRHLLHPSRSKRK